MNSDSIVSPNNAPVVGAMCYNDRSSSHSLVLRRFASLLDTHRYYGSVHATCKECLDLQKTELPKMFSQSSSGGPCCQIPSLSLQQPSAFLPSAATSRNQAIDPIKLTKPIAFSKAELPNLPLSLLEECSNLFKTIWQGRLRLAKKTMNSVFSEILNSVPPSPAAVATNVKALEFTQRCPSDSVQSMNLVDKVVIPMILSMAMDWKLPNDETITIKLMIPGMIEGTFLPNSSLQFARIELDKRVLVNSISSRVKSLLQDCLHGVYRMQISPEWIQRQTDEQAKEQEEEVSYVDDCGRTPLEQLFDTAEPIQAVEGQDVADKKKAKRTNDQISQPSANILPQRVEQSRRFSFDRLGMLSRAASQLRTNSTSKLKRQKTAYGEKKNAVFDSSMIKRTASGFHVQEV